MVDPLGKDRNSTLLDRESSSDRTACPLSGSPAEFSTIHWCVFIQAGRLPDVGGGVAVDSHRCHAHRVVTSRLIYRTREITVSKGQTLSMTNYGNRV
ncbi:MAG: hypothetical protein CMJ81_11055 [Planctomycetaceae bacterium]|nr:hypothetical protein [Planctomycetaceae bacterium]